MTPSLPWYVEQTGAPQSKAPSITEIKQGVSIRRVLIHYGATLPNNYSMEWLSIRCPFHKDEHASASFNEKLGKFNCFTCDLGGDVIDLVCQQEHLDTGEALRWISTTLL